MKKLLFCLFMLPILLGCSKNGKDVETSNSLKGTLWSRADKTFLDDEEYTRYIEFSDDKNVSVWDTYMGNTYSGIYTVVGNKVVFDNLYDSYWRWNYIEATFTSRSMTIRYSYGKDGKETYTETFVKE